MGRKSLLGNIRIIPTDDPLTASSGLGPMIEAFHKSILSKEFYRHLPKRNSARSLGSRRQGLIFLSSFLYGHDAIDDLEEFDGDDFLENFYRGELPAPRTVGDFLKDFESINLNGLSNFLSFMGHRIHNQFQNSLPDEHKPGPLHLSIDSTPHVQHGTKMEGASYNYDGKWCLDSQRISDQKGLTYGFQLRPGNIGKGVGAKELILQGFQYSKFSEEKYLSGDSAYLTQDVIKACMSVGAKFTITAPDTIKWTEKKDSEDLTWEPRQYSEEERIKAAKKGKELPLIELASYHWRPSWDKNKQLSLFKT